MSDADGRASEGKPVSLLVDPNVSFGHQLLRFPVRVVALVRLGRRVNESASRSRDDVHPNGCYRYAPRAIELHDAAQAMVRSGRTDDAAAAMLRAKAGRHRDELLWAASAARSEGWIEENGHTYWVNELLQAAAANRPVQNPTPALQKLFDQTSVLNDDDPARAYATLVTIDPAVGEAETMLCQRWSERGLHLRDSGGDRAKEDARREHEIVEILRPLVGPHADTDDPVLRSHIAYARAEYMFQQLAR
jgi:hypothetical protein